MTTGLQDELPLKATAALTSITDLTLRSNVTTVLKECRHIIDFISNLNLPQDDVNEGGQLDSFAEKRIAEQFLELVKLIQKLTSDLAQKFPHEESSEPAFDEDAWDLEFDLVDTARDDEAPKNEPKPTVETAEKQLSDSSWALGSMLDTKLLEFADRLEFALNASDTWVLLEELDDYSHKFLKATLALYFSLLGIFSNESRGALLPEYTSSVEVAIDLRREVTDLTANVDRFNGAIAKRSGADCIPYVVALSEHLARFCQRPAYRNLRTQDKREFINFRRDLYTIRHVGGGSINTNKLRLTVEGFSKFLESLHAINLREVLVLHDKQILQEIQTVTLPNLLKLFQEDEIAAAPSFVAIMEKLSTIYGRDPELDTLINNFRADPQKVHTGAAGFSLLQEIHRLSRAILGTLG